MKIKVKQVETPLVKNVSTEESNPITTVFKTWSDSPSIASIPAFSLDKLLVIYRPAINNLKLSITVFY